MHQNQASIPRSRLRDSRCGYRDALNFVSPSTPILVVSSRHRICGHGKTADGLQPAFTRCLLIRGRRLRRVSQFPRLRRSFRDRE
jgi:hypothetical protein